MDLHRQFVSGQQRYAVDNRQCPRFKLEVPIRIYPRNSSVIRGSTVDISESGIAVMLRDEIPLGEVVRLEFTVLLGPVEVHAVARQRNAFRYGFQFVEPASVQDVIGRTCRELAIEQALRPPKSL
jgi:c-di-GMP-binding flagellar brake protein YcgR